MSLAIRAYEPNSDLDAVDRIWREVGWLDRDDQKPHLEAFLDALNVEVGLIDGEPECAVVWSPGSIRYQNTDLPLCAVTGVTTSRLGRRRGFATTMTARAVRDGAGQGAAVAALGIFDQGFYDRIGFGTGPYEYRVNVDPASLAVDHVPYRQPVRLSVDDHDEIHRAMTTRHRGHGSVVLDPPATTKAECNWTSGMFGLGYRDDLSGELTHCLVAAAVGENGPYRILRLAYREPSQLLELLRLIKELGDQVTTVRMAEPADIQLQDLIDTPLRRQAQTKNSAHATGIDAFAIYQYRILDLPTCVAARQWPGPPVRFNLTLTDPAVEVLARNGEHSWPGVAGEWTITIGANSRAEPGHDSTLAPGVSVTASVNAFTRAWLGCRSPSSVAITDDLTAPASLLAALDEALALPTPHPGWDF